MRLGEPKKNESVCFVFSQGKIVRMKKVPFSGFLTQQHVKHVMLNLI